MDLDGNSTAWGALRRYLRLVHVIKPLSQLEMFYNVSQPTGTATSVQHAEALFKKLRLNDSMANNFETAWKGYQFARQIRTKIAEGDATIFPVHES